MSKPLAIVAGAGAGLGQALVTAFEQNGYAAFGLNRSVPSGAQTNTLACDLADPVRTSEVLSELMARHGAPVLVVHNTARLVISQFEKTSNEDFEETWRAMVLSAVNLARGVLPVMADAGQGCFIVSGATASLRGGRNFSAFASAKAGLRALTQSLAREYGPEGVHVAHVILDGILDTRASRNLHGLDPSRMMKPEEVADVFLSVARQPGSTWTHELDLRPQGEAF